MNHFRQSIVFFGFVLPMVAVAVVVGGLAFLRNKVAENYNNKAALCKSYNANLGRAAHIEANIAEKRHYIANWSETLHQETVSTVSAHLREIGKKLPAKEFQQAAFAPGNASGLGNASAQQAISLNLSYRATFRAMQRAMLELESRMPQLQLNALTVNRSPQSNILNFQLTYTVWED